MMKFIIFAIVAASLADAMLPALPKIIIPSIFFSPRPAKSLDLTLTPHESPLKMKGQIGNKTRFAIDHVDKRYELRQNGDGSFEVNVNVKADNRSMTKEADCSMPVVLPKKYYTTVYDQFLDNYSDQPAYEMERLMNESGCGSTISMMSSAHGKYLRALRDSSQDRNEVDMAPLKTTKWHIQAVGLLVMLRPINDTFRFLSAMEDGSVVLRNATDYFEYWLPFRNENGAWSFLGTNRKWLSAEANGTVHTVVKTGEKEKFWVDEWTLEGSGEKNRKERHLKITLPADQSTLKINGKWGGNGSFVIELKGDDVNTRMSFRPEENGSFLINIDVNWRQLKVGKEYNTTMLWEEVGRRVSLKSIHGTYLRAWDNLYNINMVPCKASSDSWELEDIFESGMVTLRAIHEPERYLSSVDANGRVFLNDYKMSYWAPFKNEDGSWSFYSYDGQWLSAGVDGTVRTVEYCGASEHFWIGKE